MFISQGYQGSLPEGMPPQMLLYRYFAKMYQWTPQQVDDLPLEALEWLPVIETAAMAAAEFEQQRAERMARAKSR